MKIFQAWVLPLAAAAVFLGLLVGAIPYASGYGWTKVPLLPLMQAMGTIRGWEHTPFVPLISLILIGLRAPRILQEIPQGSNWGAALIALGVMFYCLGLKAEMEYFGFAAIQILVAGLVIWFWGMRVFRLVGFAWLFLFFAWPMPFLDGVVAVPLRLEMSQISCHLLNLFGTPCVQSGTAVLSAPDLLTGLKLGGRFQIDIDDPCSGLYSLFAMMMMAALAGYMAVRNSFDRVLVFLAAFPLAVAGNVVRILLLVWGTEHFGPALLGTEDHPSLFHLGCGYSVYLLGLLLLIGLISALNSRRWQQTRARLWDFPAQLFHPARPEIPPGARTAD